MRLCDDDDWWTDYLLEGASDHIPQLEVDLPEPSETPRLLGPDGEPLPRLGHRFGFQPRPVMEE